MRVGVVGAVGRTTAVCLAELGHEAICVDVDRQRIRATERGQVPFREQGLERLLQQSARLGRLRLTNEARAAVEKRDVVMIAVGTPRGNAGAIDLSFIRNAAQAAAPSLSPLTVVPLKSAVTVGTAREGREIRRLARREQMRLALNVRPNCSTISA